MYTFGQIPLYQSENKFEVGVSDDKRAMTITFSDFVVQVEASKLPAPILSHVFSLVVPLEGNDKMAEIEFIISAFILTTEGATATLLTSINGQTTVADFPANTDQSFEQVLKFTAQSPSECRLSVFLLAGRNSTKNNAAAHLSVTAIDAEVLPRTLTKV